MAHLSPLQLIGGRGGSAFHFTGESNGAALKKIQVWVGGWQVKAIKVWLTDGQSQQFGWPNKNFSEFEFQDGEHISSLSLWGNADLTRLGAIKFKTNHSREFFAHMTEGLTTEYPIDVGSGICLGVSGRAHADIDCLGFVFINTVKSAVLTNIHYPTLQQVNPEIATEEIKSLSYTNKCDVTQTYTAEVTNTMKKKSSWSVTNKMEATFSIQVSARIPEIPTGCSFTVGEEKTYGLGNVEEKTQTFSLPVQVPPRKTVVVNFTIERATVDLPYTGTVEITCHNGSVLKFPTKGTYKGVTYTDAKTTVTEK